MPSLWSLAFQAMARSRLGVQSKHVQWCFAKETGKLVLAFTFGTFRSSFGQAVMVDMAKRFGIHPPKTTMKVIKAGKQHLDLLASGPEGRHSTVNVNHIVTHGA